MIISPTQYSPTSPAYSPSSPAVRFSASRLQLLSSAQATLDTATVPSMPPSTVQCFYPTQYSPTSPAYSPSSPAVRFRCHRAPLQTPVVACRPAPWCTGLQYRSKAVIVEHEHARGGAAAPEREGFIDRASEKEVERAARASARTMSSIERASRSTELHLAAQLDAESRC